MHLLWFITIATLSFLHWQVINGNDLAGSSSSDSGGVGGVGSSGSHSDDINSNANNNHHGNVNVLSGGGGGGIGMGIGSAAGAGGVNGGHQQIGGSTLSSSSNNNNIAVNSSLLSSLMNTGSSSSSSSGGSSGLGGGGSASSGSIGIGFGVGSNPGIGNGNLGMSSMGNSLNLGASGGVASNNLGTMPMSNSGGMVVGSNGVMGGIVPHHGGSSGPVYGHPLAGLATMGIKLTGMNGLLGRSGGGGGGSGLERGHHGGSRLHTAMIGGGSSAGIAGAAGMGGGGGGSSGSFGGGGSSGSFDGGGGLVDSSYDRSVGGQNPYYEHFISEHTVMAVFTSQGQVGGPCRYMPATRRQNHQCRKEYGLPDTIREARRLATTHCEDQFRYDRWNCSIETRGKRNIFKKLYKETAFVHALTAAAMTHSISRACAEGRMTKCTCGLRKQDRVGQNFKWGGCNDNLKHGKRVTRSFLELRDGEGDEVTEILRHDSEVGIEAVSTSMKDKCKCHGVSGSCSMKTCWKKMADFNDTAALLRQKYNQAIRKAPNTRTMRRDAPTSRMKKPKQRRKKQQSQYTTLYYLETSPTYCSVTKDRQCLHPDNCANLCCGRGYTTQEIKLVDKCRCRFNNGRCCQLICDFCSRYEDRFFCK